MLPSLPDYIQDYYHSQKAIPIADSTLYQYLHFYQEFLHWLISSRVTDAVSPQNVPLKTLERLSLRDAQAFVAYLLERPSKTHPNKRMTRRSVALRLVGIKALYRFLTEESEPNADGEPYFYRNVWNKVKLKTHAETTTYRNHKLQEMAKLRAFYSGWIGNMLSSCHRNRALILRRRRNEIWRLLRCCLAPACGLVNWSI